MRISSQQIFDAGIQSLQKHSSEVVDFQRQISTGQRYAKASENPLAAGLGVQVSLKRAVFTMYEVNQNVVNASLTSTDTQLASLYNMMSRFQQMTVQASNDALGPDVRKQLAFQADVLIKSIDKFSQAKDANGEQILRPLEPADAPSVLVAPTINLQSALTYKEVMGGAVGDTSNILTALIKIQNSLTAGNAPIAADVSAMQAGITLISQAQAKVGVLQNELDSAVQSAETQELNTEMNRGSLLDTDLAEATAGLARSNALLQAVQSIISGMDTNSLFKKL